MSQPPYPPQGGNDPQGDQPGRPGRNPVGASDDPTRKFGAPSGPQGEGQRDQTQQFGQPGYAQHPGQPHGQPGQPYGHPGQPYGHPGQPYGQPVHGQPLYGQQGPIPYGQPPYGQPGQQWAPPGGPGGQPPANNRNTLIALAIAGVVVLSAVGIALWLLLGDDGDPSTVAAPTSSSSEVSSSSPERSTSSSSRSSSSPSPTRSGAGGDVPPGTVPPEGLGDDQVLDALAQDCYDGDMEACDTLYMTSEVDSAYELYGGTCAGRQPVQDASNVFCTTAFPSD